MTVAKVKTQEEALAVALIRNECRKYLTGNKNSIGVMEQLEFFHNMPAGTSLYLIKHLEMPCGYALIRNEGKSKCITGCLIKEFRGYGIGRKLFQWLTCRAGPNVILNVLKSNKRAVQLYFSLGFKVYKKSKTLLFMRYDRHSTA